MHQIKPTFGLLIDCEWHFNSLPQGCEIGQGPEQGHRELGRQATHPASVAAAAADGRGRQEADTGPAVLLAHQGAQQDIQWLINYNIIIY